MPIAQLTYVIALVISSFFGRAEGPTDGAARVFVPQTARVRPARVHIGPRTDLFLGIKLASQLDDEIEIPGAPEDQIPDDHGQAFSPDDNRCLDFIAFSPLSSVGWLIQTPTHWHFHELSSDRLGRQRFLSLCRIRC
ncbi:hypothetical protein [Singulisphaera sp. GP187]|uniref:hypothetical protein n=1 Tax=Singulisphaera sp. GP187 TaxID=1882752 RepID=UPI0009419867|nr:hypothetical protein [Singulisphaera sp. GP187]